MFFIPRRKLEMPAPGRALKGRAQAIPVENRHFVNGNPIEPPFPDGMAALIVGMGCFWGAERVFWQAPGVHTQPPSATPPAARPTRLLVHPTGLTRKSAAA